jgi:hypothetical protein
MSENYPRGTAEQFRHSKSLTAEQIQRQVLYLLTVAEAVDGWHKAWEVLSARPEFTLKEAEQLAGFNALMGAVATGDPGAWTS